MMREAQVEIRIIGQQRGVGPVAARVPYQFAVLAIDARKMRDYFRQSNHRKTRSVNYRAHALRLQARAGTAVEMRRRKTAAQMFDNPGSIHIAGSLTSRDKKLHVDT
jgi:hypothetical protein